MTTGVAVRRSRLASPRTASVLAALVVVLIVILPITGALSGHMSSTSVTAVISLLVVIAVSLRWAWSWRVISRVMRSAGCCWARRSGFRSPSPRPSTRRSCTTTGTAASRD